MSEENQFRNPVKEMRSVVDMDDVKEFIRLARNMESKHDQLADDLENAAESKYLDYKTRTDMLEAAIKERDLAHKWNALWAVFDHAEFHEVKN